MLNGVMKLTARVAGSCARAAGLDTKASVPEMRTAATAVVLSC